MDANSPRVVDNDRDEITVTVDGTEIRGWSYRDEAERRVKMLAAHEFCEGWFQAGMHRKPPVNTRVKKPRRRGPAKESA